MALFRLKLSEDLKNISLNRLNSFVERLNESEVLVNNEFEGFVTNFESKTLGVIGGVAVFGGTDDSGEDTEDEDEDGDDGTDDTRCGQSGPLSEVVALAW